MDRSTDAKLPPEIASRFRPTDRFIVWAEGDTLYLVRVPTPRITPPPVTQIVEQAPEGDPLTLDEINEIVHQVRSQSKAS